MVSPSSREQWSPASWPVSFRWRLIATLAVLTLTAASIFALSRGGQSNPEIAVVAAAQRWPEGHPPSGHATVNVPADLAPLFVEPSELKGTVASINIPEGTLISPQMLRPHRGADNTRTASLMRFRVNAELWPDPGPAAGDRAVFSPSAGGCAIALVSLAAIADEGAEALATIETTPELASTLSDEPWWIWESPPAGWPACEGERDDAVSTPEREGGVAH